MEQQAKKSVFKKWWFWMIVIVVLFIILGSAKDKGQQVSTQNSKEQTTTTGTPKQYQEVFQFNGNGAKKSEPFNIQGDRFKISYDCKGDPSATLCTAFVFKVGSSLPQAVMNNIQAVKDETIIYTNMAGKGEYYIDANVLGSYSMVVYDYR